MLLTTIIGYFYFDKKVPNFICSKTIGIITAMLFTVIFFYTYTGVLGKNIAIIDIASFFIATILGEFLSYVLIINNFKCSNKIAIIVLIILFVCFAIFNYFTPNIGLFKDTASNDKNAIYTYESIPKEIIKKINIKNIDNIQL